MVSLIKLICKFINFISINMDDMSSIEQHNIKCICNYAYNLGKDIAILRGMIWDTHVACGMGMGWWMIRFSVNNKLIRILNRFGNRLLYRCSLDDLIFAMMPQSIEFLPTHRGTKISKVFYMSPIRANRWKDVCFPKNKRGIRRAHLLRLRPLPNRMTFWQKKYLMKIVVGIITINKKKDKFIDMCSQFKGKRRVSRIKLNIKKQEKKQKKQLDKLILLIKPMALKRRDTFLRDYIKSFRDRYWSINGKGFMKLNVTNPLGGGW